MKRFQLICLSLFLVAASAFAQVTVKGTVTSAEDSQGLPGVSIIVKGTTHGTVTDFDGKYELEVAPNATLQFSFMGYKTVERTASAKLDVVLESDAIMMDEVVSLGYSSAKKAELSSAVVTLSSEALTDVTSSDVGNMLQGKVAGVQISNANGQPGEAAQIRIRGTGSITASSSPVYVVDGVMGGSFNPNDVETISVLKDAGATGIYGASAAGGVIVVTTKQGNKSDKTHVDFKATIGAKQALYQHYHMYNSEGLYNFQKNLYSAGVFNSIRPKTLLEQDYNWQDEFFHTGIIQDYYVAVSGGTKKLGYYASADYYGEEGTMVGTGMKKVSGRFNMNADLFKWLDMNLRVNFDKSTVNYESSWTMLDDAFNKMPWDNPYDEVNGGYLYVSNDKRSDNNKPWYSQSMWNSLQSSMYNYNKSDNFSFSTDIQFNVHFTDWLTLTSTNRFGYSSYKGTAYIDPRTFDSQYKNGHLSNNIGLSRSFGTTDILKASYQWAEHSVSGMLGWEWGTWGNEYTYASGVGMPNGVDALNATSPYSVSGYKIPGASWAAFVQAQYDYAKRYFVTATFRTEASSAFAKGHRVGYFPSVAASWLISNEGFMKDQNVVSLLKLRASYGVTGNNNIPAYQYLATYALSKLYQNQVAADPSRLANPLLAWERANMAAVGIDLALINRIDMSIDLYNTDNVALLLDVPVAPSTGFFEKTANAGSVRNQGIEYKIDAQAMKMKNFEWNIGFNIGFNKNTVTETPNHEAFLQTASNVHQQVAEGQDIYTWYMKEWAGVNPENGDPLWYIYGEDGSKTTTNDYNAATETTVGKATPLFQGGLQTDFKFFGVFINLNSNFTYGNKIYNYSRMSTDADGAYIGYNQLDIEAYGWKRWSQPGDVATHPKPVLNGNKNSNQISSRYLEDGSYFRLRNVTVGYDFPRELIKKALMTKCRIYFSGDNLFTLSKFSGMDPEVSLGRGGSLAGFYGQTYPVGRTFQGGVEISF